MKKSTTSPAGFSTPRIIGAVALCSAAVGMLAMLSIAATPPSGTVTPTSRITYTSGPFLISNPSGTVPGAEPTCSAQQPCDDFTLTVPVGAFNTTHNLVITVNWPNVAEDYDIYLRQGNATVKQAASSSVPEVITTEATAGTYVIRIVPYAVAGGTTTTTVELVEKPPTPPPSPLGVGTPRYHNFAAPGTLGNRAGEPTLGAGKPSPQQLGGPTLYIASLQTLRVTWDDCKSPAGNLWENKSFATTSATTLDPILFTDFGAGRPAQNNPARLFVSQLGPKTSFLAYSDDNGETYLQSQGSGINSGVDHQTVGGGPYRNNATPPPPPHPLYPNAIYYASQDAAVAQLGRSDTGSQTFGPAVPMYNLTQCGGLHGHVKVAPDGTVYIPNKNCGSKQAVVVSEDNGLTFSIRTIPDSVGGGTDPSVGIDADGKIYVAYQNADGRAKVAVSANRGLNWAPSIDVGDAVGIRNNVFPGAVGGSSGRATVQFLATTTSGNYQAIGAFTGVWHIYAAHTFDGGATWSTVRVTPENDPVQRGSICTGGTTCGADRNLLDFNDIEIDQRGRVIIAYADGCIGCTSPTGSDSRASKATIARQSGGKRMLAQFDPPAEPHAPEPPNVTSVTKDNNGIVAVRWLEPDNGGSPITGYNVYRREGTGSYGAPLVTLPGNRTSYDDLTAISGTQYFYKVTALNAQGESGNCGEFPVGNAASAETNCVLPGLTILTDPKGDIITPVGESANPGWDLRSLALAEPFGLSDKIVFTLKVENLTVVPANTRWPIQFIVGGNGYFVDMSTMPTDGGSPVAPVFKYGTFNPTGGTGGVYGAPTTRVGNADSESTFSSDGTIRIVVSRNKIGNPAVGSNLTGFLIRVRFGTDAASVTPDNMSDSLAPLGSYTVVGNAFCRLNTAPIAALAASVNSGQAPLSVTFDASGSFDPDTGDTIGSYIFNFGDGTAPVEQASPIAQHVYRDSGNYSATVRVKDSRGKFSDNTAEAVLQVLSTLQSVVSRKAHNGTPFDVNLPTSGLAGIEPRTTAAGNHTIIFTFARDLTNVTTANASTSDGNVAITSRSVGPAPNQYTVNVSNVPNERELTVRLDNVQDTAGADLTAVIGRMGALLGDANGDGTVNSADAQQTRTRSGQQADGSNFRSDVNVDGFIDSGDATIVRSRSGTSLR